MKLEDVIKVLINNGVLLCDYEIKEDNVTRLYPRHLSKHDLRHNKILNDLTMLSLSDVRDELKKSRTPHS